MKHLFCTLYTSIWNDNHGVCVVRVERIFVGNFIYYAYMIYDNRKCIWKIVQKKGSAQIINR